MYQIIAIKFDLYSTSKIVAKYKSIEEAKKASMELTKCRYDVKINKL